MGSGGIGRPLPPGLPLPAFGLPQGSESCQRCREEDCLLMPTRTSPSLTEPQGTVLSRWGYAREVVTGTGWSCLNRGGRCACNMRPPCVPAQCNGKMVGQSGMAAPGRTSRPPSRAAPPSGFASARSVMNPWSSTLLS